MIHFEITMSTSATRIPVFVDQIYDHIEYCGSLLLRQINNSDEQSRSGIEHRPTIS